MSEWVKMLERQPAPGQEILLWIKGAMGGGWIEIEIWDEVNAKFFAEAGPKWDYGEFWMPIPEGPTNDKIM